MSLDDLKKLPQIDNPDTAPLVQLAEIETVKECYGVQHCDRFPVYVKGIYSHPKIDSGKQHLIIVPLIRTIEGKPSPVYTTQAVAEIVEYVPRALL